VFRPYACRVPGRAHVQALMVLVGIGVLVAGVWFWNDYSYWSCIKHSGAGGFGETCVSRPRHPHRLLGVGLVLGGLTWLIGSLVAARLWSSSRERKQAPPVEP
jgi:hypothetical protein